MSMKDNDAPKSEVQATLSHNGQSVSVTGTAVYICPDLLRFSQLGAADNWRGHVVRGFFRVLRVVTGV